MAVQEAVPIEDSPHLRQVFGPEILSRLPKSGDERVRRTALHLIGSAFSLSSRHPVLTDDFRDHCYRKLRVMVHDAALPSPGLTNGVSSHECDHLRCLRTSRPYVLLVRSECPPRPV